MQVGVVDRDTHQYYEAKNLHLVFTREELPKLKELNEFIAEFLTKCREDTNEIGSQEEFYTHDHFSLHSELWRLEDTDVEIVVYDKSER